MRRNLPHPVTPEHLPKPHLGHIVTKMTQTSVLDLGVPAVEFRKLRESLGLTQADVARKFGCHPRTVLRWENGERPTQKAALECLRMEARSRKLILAEDSHSFKFIDLFAGIGGLRLGFEAAGGECVFTSEWDKYCQITYRQNFGEEHPIAGDIRQVPAEHIPAHDVLLAGFPCQPFSIAGVSKKNALGRPHGFACEAQGTLFYEVSRILRYHRPKAFLLENVKNLVSHDHGNTFRVIKDVLQRELGYYVHTRIIDAKPWVPQHRERIFIVGFRDLTPFEWDDLQVPSVDYLPALRTILHPEDGTEATEDPYTVRKGKVNPKYRLTDNLWQYLQKYAAKHRAKGNGFGFGLFGPDDVARTLSARYYKDGSEILVRRRRGNPRRLTPRECSRLMGFDRPGHPFQITVSDTRAYKQFGNAVVVPVVTAIAKLLRPHITGTARPRDQFLLPLTARSA